MSAALIRGKHAADNMGPFGRSRCCSEVAMVTLQSHPKLVPIQNWNLVSL